MTQEFNFSAALGYQINRTGQLMTDEIAKRFSANGFDLTAQDFGILMRLKKQGAITQLQLGEQLMRDKTTVTRRVDRLVKKGLLERMENPEDRRSFLVQLTSEGGSAVSSMIPLVGGFQQELLEGVPDEKRDALFQVLAMISNKILQQR